MRDPQRCATQPSGCEPWKKDKLVHFGILVRGEALHLSLRQKGSVQMRLTFPASASAASYPTLHCGLLTIPARTVCRSAVRTS
jgi:hypothetical protein